VRQIMQSCMADRARLHIRAIFENITKNHVKNFFQKM